METTTELEQKTVLIKEIALSKSNPRKHFDDESIKELAQSIREKGVLQPVLLRPLAKGYELVCGERRYHACRLAGIVSIPAVIRDLSEDEALEVQIVENLQRKDIHPMEEAAAFKQIIEVRGFSVHEISARVGKSDRYVAERLKLNNLTESWQKAFFENRFLLVTALRVARLSPSAQDELYKKEGKRAGQITINNWTFNQYTGDLQTAIFPLADASLSKLGACTECQYNTAVHSLFPEDQRAPQCGYVKCFTEKADAWFTRELDNALKDPSIVLICDYNPGTRTRDLRNAGHRVYVRNEITVERRPETIESWEEWFEDNRHARASEVESKKEWEREHKNYERLEAEYQKKIASGKYTKALVVEGDGAGSYKYIKIDPITNRLDGKSSVTAAGVKKKMSEGTVTVEDLRGEIKRMEDGEKRKKELDQEKLTVKLYEFLGSQKTYVTDKALDNTELIALLIVLAEKCGYGAGARIYKPLGLSFSASSNHTNLYKGLAGLKKPYALVGVFNKIVKSVLVTELNSQAIASDKSGKAAALHALVNRFWPKESQQLINVVREEALQREERLAEKVEDLKKKISALKPGKKKAA